MREYCKYDKSSLARTIPLMFRISPNGLTNLSPIPTARLTNPFLFFPTHPVPLFSLPLTKSSTTRTPKNSASAPIVTRIAIR